jgi:hypothetical protein
MSRIEVQRALLRNRELDKILSIMKASNLSVSDIEGRIQEKNESPSELDSFVKKRQERNWTRNMRKNARKGREVKARKKEERHAQTQNSAKGETKTEELDREERERSHRRTQESTERGASKQVPNQGENEGQKLDVTDTKEA